jgi:ABC-2 type transport system ATP-binding protein
MNNQVDDIVISNLSKSYGTKYKLPVVKNISFTVKSGSVFGFIGPNGAGKTSTIKMLVGLSHPTAGAVSVCGGSPTDSKIQKQIGFMPESPLFYQYLTGEEFLDFIASIFQLEHKEKRITQVLHEVDLVHAKSKPIRTYSKGMLQRLGLAQAIINDPKVLFLDEPLDGLDPLGRALVKKVISTLKTQGKTIFINTHILSDVEEMCDMVGILDNGELLTVNTPANIKAGYTDLEGAFVDIIHKRRSNVTLL